MASFSLRPVFITKSETKEKSMRLTHLALSLLNSKKARRSYSQAFMLVTTLTICILLTSTALGAPSPESATQEAPQIAWDLQYVDDPPFMQNMRDHSLRFKSDGTPCVAFGGDHLYYACYNSTAHVWVKETIPDPDNVRVGEYASLGFNDTNDPFISYYDADRGYLKLAYKMSGVWNILIVDPNPLLNASVTPDAPASTETPTPTLPAGTPTTQVETPAAPAPESTESFTDQLVDFIRQRPWRDPLLQVETPTIAPDNGGFGKFSSIAIDWANGVHISYFDQVRGSLKYAYWDGVFWVVEEIDRGTHPHHVGVWSSIATDSRVPPRPHIAYMSEQYDDLKYAIKKSTGWEYETVDGDIDPTYDKVGVFASIAVDSNDRPHISYHDFTHHTLKYAKYNPSTEVWQISTLDNNGDTGWWTSIAIDSNDAVYISYYNNSGGNLRMAKNPGGGWSLSTIYSNDDVGMYSSIDVDKNDRPGISFFNVTTGSLEFTYHDANGWNRSFIARIADVGLSTSLALDSLGVPYMSYFDDTVDQLKYARAIGTSWFNTVVTSTIQAGAFSSIKIGKDGIPRIAYYDMEHGNLEYAVWKINSWASETVDKTGDVGQYVSLAIDSSGYPHISYYDATDRNLNYAYWSAGSSSWITQTIDTHDNVGRYTSIALASNNRPFISYFDTHNNDLMVIYKSPINTWVSVIVDSNVSITPPDKPWPEAYTSIALDNGNNPHISYFDDTYDQLKYARGVNVGGAVSWPEVGTIVDGLTTQSGRFNSIAINKAIAINQPSISYYDDTYHELRFAERSCAGPCTWAVQTVDTAGDVGMWSSLAYSYNNLPVISYYDNSNGALKIAFYPGYALPNAKYYLPLIRETFP